MMDKSECNNDVLTTVEDNISIKTKCWLFIKQAVMGMILFGLGNTIIRYFEITNTISFTIGTLMGGAFVIYCFNENRKMYEEGYNKRVQDIATKFFLEKTKWEQEQINTESVKKNNGLEAYLKR